MSWAATTLTDGLLCDAAVQHQQQQRHRCRPNPRDHQWRHRALVAIPVTVSHKSKSSFSSDSNATCCCSRRGAVAQLWSSACRPAAFIAKPPRVADSAHFALFANVFVFVFALLAVCTCSFSHFLFSVFFFFLFSLFFSFFFILFSSLRFRFVRGPQAFWLPLIFSLSEQS